MRRTVILIVGFLGVVLASKAFAISITETFDSTTLNPNLTVSTTSGFSLNVTGGKALVAKTAGTGNGFVTLDTTFQLLGDFSVTVVADRTDLTGNGEMGLAIVYPSGFTDAYFGPLGIQSNIFVPPGFGFNSLIDPSSPVTFRIRRTGNGLFDEFDNGSGFQVIHSATDPALGGPVTAQLFLLQEFGNTAANSGTFDNFSITADSFNGYVPTPVPEPSTLSLGMAGVGLLLAYRRRRGSRQRTTTQA